MRTAAPGQASRALASRLRAVESRNVTHVAEGWPVFWEEAHGANVRDADGNVYIDLSGAFGVALLGHGHPGVRGAVGAQADRLVHGMGDVHPSALKVELLERLCAITPWDAARGVLASTGSEAVEIALKTAHVATGRPGVVAFTGAYHGLTLGSLAVTERDHFRGRFLERLYGGITFVPFPDQHEIGPDAMDLSLAGVERALGSGAPNGDPIGAVIIEPVQGRAGVRLAPQGFMSRLSRLVADSHALLVADEIFTGVGRCGSLLASERVGLVPDVVCLGKALGGGLPLSACLGSAEVMDAWPESAGEAIHTSTFLGHPLACASALAFLDALEQEAAVERARVLGARLVRALRHGLGSVEGVCEVRGLGLLIGIEFAGSGRGARIAEAALGEGLIVLPAGARGEVLQLSPPADLNDAQAEVALAVLCRLAHEVV